MSTYDILDISKDNYFSKSHPAKNNEMINVIEIKVQPLIENTEVEEVYKSPSPVSIVAQQTIEIVANYNSIPAVDIYIDFDTDNPSNIRVQNYTHYAWGSVINVFATDSGTFTITLTGTTHKIEGEETITLTNGESLAKNAINKFTKSSNGFLQTKELCNVVATNLNNLFSDNKRNISIDWRGLPSLEMRDLIRASEYKRSLIDVKSVYYVTKNQIQYDGSLRYKSEGRKLA